MNLVCRVALRRDACIAAATPAVAQTPGSSPRQPPAAGRSPTQQPQKPEEPPKYEETVVVSGVANRREADQRARRR